MLKHDLGYGEAVHIKISNNGKNYLTGNLNMFKIWKILNLYL